MPTPSKEVARTPTNLSAMLARPRASTDARGSARYRGSELAKQDLRDEAGSALRGAAEIGAEFAVRDSRPRMLVMSNRARRGGAKLAIV